MKYFLFIIVSIVITACNGTDHCKLYLQNEYSEIDSLINVMITKESWSAKCKTEIIENYIFYGITETDEYGYFDTDSLSISNIKISTFDVLNDSNKLLCKFIAYDFQSEKELQKFEAFAPSITRDLNHSKELHEFYHFNKRSVLYYKGFP